MRIGAHFAAPGPLTVPFDLADQVGATCFQCFIGESAKYWPYKYGAADLAEFKARKLRSNMVVAVHGNYIVNIAYTGPEKCKYEMGIRSIKSQLEICDQMGADFLVMHTGSFKEQGRMQGVENLVRACEIILKENYSTVLLLENSAGGGSQIGHVDMLAEAIRRVNSKQLAMCLDTEHLWGDGGDVPNKDFRATLWGEYGDLIKFVHYNMPDMKVNQGSHLDRHREPWTKGRWDQQVMLDIAAEWGPHVPLCMECSPESVPINMMVLEEHGY